MASRELTLQSDIVKSARMKGGYARKLSHKFSVGIPDLIIYLPTFVPCLVEVKDLGEAAYVFDRDIGVTPKQGHELELFNKVNAQYGESALILVGLQHRGARCLVALPQCARRLTAAYTLGPSKFTERGVGGIYDLVKLFDVSRIGSFGRKRHETESTAQNQAQGNTTGEEITDSGGQE